MAALLLAGCAGDAPTRATASLAVACESIAAALEQLAPMRAAGRLSMDQVQTVTGIKNATEPYCASNSIVDPAAVVGFVEAGAAQLRLILR